MSTKKQNRQKRRNAGGSRPAKGGITASKVFIALILLAIVIAAVATALSEPPPVDCPPGQVWSDAHNHCH